MFVKYKKWEPKYVQAILFVLTFTLFLIWLWPQQSMINISSDAEDIWRTISTYYSGEIYPSYVLYKGFMAVYPYVWLYQLAQFFGTNEFLFVMIYHAILFAYISTVGVPKIVHHFFKWSPGILPRVLFVCVVFVAWRPTYALNQVMVDLPSCAVFILTVNCAVKTESENRTRKFIYVGLTGLLCSLGTVISGQYSVAMVCVMLYVLTKMRPLKCLRERTRRLELCCCLAFFLLAYMCPVLCRVMFEKNVVQPMRDAGATSIVSANMWLERGLIYMMNNSRLLSGTRMSCPRGFSILTAIYGSPENALGVWELAGQGGFGWTIRDWFSVFARYPVDMLCMMFDKAFIAVSVDLQRNSLAMLVASYTALYISLYQLVMAKTVKRIFSANTWLVLGIVATIAPLLVLSVEMRCAISIQAMIFGSALLGPTLPSLGRSIKNGVGQCIREKSLSSLKGKNFPWAVALCVLFVACCVVHMGGLYAQSDWGVGMLFRWF